MKIAIYFDDTGVKNLDLRYPDKGNPGIGGTEYCYLMLAKHLSIYDQEIETTIYHYNESNILPESVNNVIIKNKKDCIAKSSESEIDYLLFCTELGKSWYKLLDTYNQDAMLWAHCFLSIEELELATSSERVKKVVFVGKQMYDMYLDHDISKKSTYIYNMIVSQSIERQMDENIVLYIGSLVKGKGFDVLARCWSSIKKEVPDAKLYVIGTGKLYRRDAELGKFNVASKEFEEEFIGYLLNEEGMIDKSVKFLGLLGEEKKYVISKAKVGIINPTAKTETFGISGVEMQAQFIPIATKGSLGLLDTVIDKKTGLLHNTEKQFIKNIIYLLKNDDINYKMGCNAHDFVISNFSPEVVMPKWISLFYNCGNSEKFYDHVNYVTKNGKFIRLANRFLKYKLKLKKLPSYVEVEECLREIKNGRKEKIKS